MPELKRHIFVGNSNQLRCGRPQSRDLSRVRPVPITEEEHRELHMSSMCQQCVRSVEADDAR